MYVVGVGTVFGQCAWGRNCTPAIYAFSAPRYVSYIFVFFRRETGQPAGKIYVEGEISVLFRHRCAGDHCRSSVGGPSHWRNSQKAKEYQDSGDP